MPFIGLSSNDFAALYFNKAYSVGNLYASPLVNLEDRGVPEKQAKIMMLIQ
jgi:hypothetical protein